MCGMKIRIRRPRSCLGWFLWPLGILLSLVLLNNLYAWVRIFAAQAAAYELAGELGYTPDDFLSSGSIQQMWISSPARPSAKQSLCLSPRWNCLTLKRGCWQRNQEHGLIDPGISYRRQIYADLPLNVNGVSGRPDAWMTFPRIPAMSWFLAGEAPAMQTTIVEWYQTAQVPARITFGDRQIDGNIAVIRWSAGRYPIWVWC